MINKKFSQNNQGFTLVEMAIVLIIIGFLLTAFLMPLKAQRDVAFQLETQATLENAKKALIGFAQAHGRLPCPATDNGGAFPDGTGTANPNESNNCISQLGFLPAVTLGIQPTDANGYAVDAWNNRIMYAVTQSNAGGAVTADYTTDNDMNDLGIEVLAQNTENLRVCTTSAGNTATRCSGGAESNYLINNAVAVIYSAGPTGEAVAGSLDEGANPIVATNPKMVFVSKDISTANPPNEFDHIVTWLSPYVLYNAMIEAGQLH